MGLFQKEAEAFAAQRSAGSAYAGELVASRLICGVDLENALAASAETKMQIINRVERMMERERLKGFRNHWSYDLNRHIALKHALDRLKSDCCTEKARRA